MWRSQTFSIDLDNMFNSQPISEQLAKFLSAKRVRTFHVVQMSPGHLEIVYLDDSKPF